MGSSSDSNDTVTVNDTMGIFFNINNWSHMNKGNYLGNQPFKFYFQINYWEINDRSSSGCRRYEPGHGECLLQPRGDHFYQEERGDHQCHF